MCQVKSSYRHGVETNESIHNETFLITLTGYQCTYYDNKIDKIKYSQISAQSPINSCFITKRVKSLFLILKMKKNKADNKKRERESSFICL